MKIRPVGAEMFHVYGRTGVQIDMTKLTVAFHTFGNASENCFDSVRRAVLLTLMSLR